MASRKLSQAIELIEVVSTESAFASAPTDYARQQGLEFDRVGPALVHLVKQRPNLELNAVVGLGVRSPATTQQIDRILDWYAGHGVHRFTINLCPAAQPRQLGEWLRRRGFRKTPGSAKMVRGPGPVSQPKCRLQVEEIGPDRAADWLQVMSAVFPKHLNHMPWAEARIGLPGWRHYIAYSGKIPAAVGALFVQDGVARLQDGVTVRMFRRRGAQAALISRRLADGMKMGCRQFTSETAAPHPRRPQVSYRNLLRAGFKVAYVRSNYLHERPRVRRNRTPA